MLQRRALQPNQPAGHFLLRDASRWLVDPPPASLPERWKVILSRGPYSYAGERKIMTEQGIDVILTKDSGGTQIVAKLDAAGDLGIPVVIIARPEPVPLPLLRSVPEAVTWCRSLRDVSASRGSRS